MAYALLVLCALAGSLFTLLLQCLLLYRRSPEPRPPRTSLPPRPVQPEPALRDYLRQEPAGPESETCLFLNAIFLFLFRELRDTALVRRWVTKKIKVELEELLQTRTAGRLLEGLSLRDVSLGEALPVFRSVRPLAGPAPEELAFELEVEYNGGFHLAIDVELVFGKSAYLFVRLSRVLGRLRLLFARLPFTHWSFAFLDDPLIDFEVKSQFEGRPMPQLTSIIVNQLKKVIKRKHTLPNYKIRLLIFGSYERETSVHCTLELGSSLWKEKTRTSIKLAELIKGNSQSVGLTFRQVQASDGDAGHVSIETVTPNSPAAIADLQKGDRIIAIGGIKVTSSVQILKLIKQAGDRVLVYYERPVGQNLHGGMVPETFGLLEDSSFVAPCPQNYEDDIPCVPLDIDSKELDPEVELAFDIKPVNEVKEEVTPAANLSPKRSMVTLASKPLGSISPILNRKLNLTNFQPSLKTQQKEGTKSTAVKSSDVLDVAQQSNRLPQGSTNKPPVPPRPQIKLTLTSCETQTLLETEDTSVEKPERPPLPTSNGDKPLEKPVKHTEPAEDLTASKLSALKQEIMKDKVSESSSSTKDSIDDHSAWESPEASYRNRQGRWTKASSIFEVESYHRYLNVALWCRDPFKMGGLICLGHVSIKLEEIALECLATSSMEYFTTFRLNAPEPKATANRTALRSLSTHKGFNEKFCYGDITLNFRYLIEGESENSSVLMEKEKESNLPEDDPMFPKEETSVAQMVFTESKHNFQDTQFQNPTWCDHCKKKVWTKAASQCMLCAYVCHKKCQDKCLSENPFCVVAERRLDAESKASVNKATGITRHIINTSSRLLNLRQVPKARQAELGVDLVEPSPKHTPNTSDNESSDTEMSGSSSPSKRAAGGGTKLVRKEGGLDDSVFIAVKEIGRDLYRDLPTDERFQKLELMLDKLQSEIDQELEHNNNLVREERETTDARKKTLLSAALSKSGERLQALTLLMIHYRAGIEDLESLENISLDQQSRKLIKSAEESSTASEVDTNDDVSQVEIDAFTCISDTQILESA
ncbi:PDZ domain-containing protein 8 isoform X2 [Microcaecilia unicolor]|uniref:PDZ domain-containing protein 8 isoform X2 n=1 Tax=Microcaecilia unicolor TaxID=1415580 RepID=A0A6P7Y0Z8_9AMPH|nr:PDZ domain-containing protein 8 isoform X2 [Microcaecilia unicolor]